MDYRYLKAFIYTVELQSFSKAAQKLCIAQSAVSRQIKLLEESLREELIIRSSKKIILTQIGKELYSASQHFDNIVNSIFNKDDQRALRIGILQGLLRNWFTPKISKFLKKFARNISIKIDTPSVLHKKLEEGELDVIFTNENIQSDIASSLKLFDEKLLLVSKTDVNINELSQYPWIVYGEADTLFKISKKSSKNIIAVESMQTILDFVKSGFGIAIIPDHIINKVPNLKIYELKNIEKSEIFMTTLNYRTMPKHMKELIKLSKN